MPEFLAWIQGSALGAVMRESGVWTYGLVNLGHILGIATLFGSVLVLDLRLLGLWPAIPMPMIARPTVPLAAVGFAVAVVSGTCMIATNGTEYIGNPFLYIKFPAIGLALLNVVVLNRLPSWRERDAREPNPHERTRHAVIGGLSLACWFVAITAGRMIGYW